MNFQKTNQEYETLHNETEKKDNGTQILQEELEKFLEIFDEPNEGIFLLFRHVS